MSACRGIHPNCTRNPPREPACVDCCFLHERNFQTSDHLEFLRHCRAIRQYVDQGAVALSSPYVAAFLVSSNRVILDIDERSIAFLSADAVLSIRHNRICSPNPEFNGRLSLAIDRAAREGEARTLVFPLTAAEQSRYTMLVEPNQSGPQTPGPSQNVACFVFPLGRRRVASARQLMSMFGLSGAEARLARALCHGETLEQFATAQGVKLPTVKTQLRSVFAKTLTDRQVMLVTLIAGIPPLR